MNKDHFSSQFNPEQSETEIGNYPALKEEYAASRQN